MYNPSITKRPLILNVPRVPLTVKPKRLRYTISSHRMRTALIVRDIPLKPGSKFVCIKTLRTGSFKLFKRPFPKFLTILTL